MEEMFEAADAGDKDEEERLFQAQRARVPDLHAVLAKLLELPARTAEGMRLKAQVALARVQENLKGQPLSDQDHVMRSLARDILAHAGGAA
ncbi:hypothetical protein IAI58_15515 [Roseomonas marmotae]|uniref:hypothetical protein n=1 Tax=Roseomonas marmotae TaxID=2768161 RepID=UPI001AD7279C|nr:hypothetical protein [Roseomonas marmotae]QTI79022.1 hypothetical protein IAI58_15515 [Roseomonas marmotae]